MGDPLQKVRPGHRLRIPASAYNAFVDAARYVQQHQRDNEADATPSSCSSGIVIVKNASGVDVPRFAVLGIDEPIFTPSDDPDAFVDRVALVGVTPSRDVHFGRFVILLDPIASGEIGRAYAAGVCPVKLSIPEDGQELRFADVTDGSTDTLTAGPQGAALILWKEDAPSSGEVWAVVRLASTGAPGQTPLLARIDGFDATAGYSGTVRYDSGNWKAGQAIGGGTVNGEDRGSIWEASGALGLSTDPATTVVLVEVAPKQFLFAQSIAAFNDASLVARSAGITLLAQAGGAASVLEFTAPPAGQNAPVRLQLKAGEQANQTLRWTGQAWIIDFPKAHL